jgi:drug/metabolite transporter (DMT)-like permease
MVIKPSSQSIPPGIVLIIGILAVSMSSIFIRFAQQEAPSLTVAAYRLFVAGLVLAPWALTRQKAELASLSREKLLLALLSGLLLAIHFHTWISSLEYTTVSSSVVLVMTSPLWLTVLARIFLNEKIPRLALAGLSIALLGGVTVAISDTCQTVASTLACPPLSVFLDESAFIGNSLALIGAITGAGYFLIGRKLRPNLSLLSYIFLVYSFAGIILVIFAVASGTPLLGFSANTYLWLLLLAFIPQLLGHSSFNYALGLLPAVYISLPLLGEPLTATVLAYFIFAEVPSPLKIFGGALILGGILLGSWPSNRT